MSFQENAFENIICKIWLGFNVSDNHIKGRGAWNCYSYYDFLFEQ